MFYAGNPPLAFRPCRALIGSDIGGGGLFFVVIYPLINDSEWRRGRSRRPSAPATHNTAATSRRAIKKTSQIPIIKCGPLPPSQQLSLHVYVYEPRGMRIKQGVAEQCTIYG